MIADDTRTMTPAERAFCSPDGPEVFHPVAHRQEIWKEDPLDVESIHGEARETFERLLDRAHATDGRGSGRILLLLGESGSGKTHLMRAFRSTAHRQHLGYVGYMQMTSSTRSYDRYLLGNLIESLDQPYWHSVSNTSGLMRLSNALAECGAVPGTQLARLRTAPSLMRAEVGKFTSYFADRILKCSRFSHLDLDLVRALFYLQRDDPRYKARVMSYLRCEDLSPADRDVLGGMVPRCRDEHPAVMAAQLGQLMWAAEQSCFVMCVDQLEDIYNLDEADVRFRRAISTVCALADRVPSSVFVIACLEDYYHELKGKLTQSMVDRVERDPDPIRLDPKRSAFETRQLIHYRLRCLHEHHGVEAEPGAPLAPFADDALQALDGLSTRVIIDHCRSYRERCVRAGGIVPFRAETGPPAGPHEPPHQHEHQHQLQEQHEQRQSDQAAVTGLEQAWNDLHTSGTFAVPRTEEGLAELLRWSIEACSVELEGDAFAAVREAAALVVELSPQRGQGWPILVAVCNKAPQGGHLGSQVAAAERTAAGRTLVLVRSTEFFKTRGSKIAQQLAQLCRRGGRLVVAEDSDWRIMRAMQQFREEHGRDPHFAAWLKAERPLSRLRTLREALDLEDLPPAPQPAAMPSPASPPTLTPPAAAVARAPAQATAPGHDHLLVGISKDRRAEPVLMERDELRRHAAVLGGSGSGKTTLALNLIEQLLAGGTPAILLDRKGDLCTYARREAWSAPTDDPRARGLRRLLERDKVDVVVYTPGAAAGRPLSVPLIPAGLGELPEHDVQRVSGQAAQALIGMLEYGPRSQKGRRGHAILSQALGLLASSTSGEPSLDDLITLIADEDPDLLLRVGRISPRHFAPLVEDLETLRISRRELLGEATGEALDVTRLLGLGPHRQAARTRLSIISTRFLGSDQEALFWVSQLLVAIGRWIGKHPAESLQAVLMIDEADLYLPAQREPATKGPLSDLLRRARSAGLGLVLATQNPGDFDYRCRENIRTWFVGQVKEGTALEKIRPMLSDARIDPRGHIASQGTGEFHVLGGDRVRSVCAVRSRIDAQQVPEADILALASPECAPGSAAR